MSAVDAPSGKVKPYVRMIMTPAGLPWDQVRAAQLEARHTSPVSGLGDGELTLAVKRLEPWRPRAAGRFAAIYLRGGVPAEGVVVDAEVQGRTIKVEIASKAAQAEALKRKAWLIGGAAVMAGCLLGQVALTLQRRAAVETQLSSLELQVARAVRLSSADIWSKENAQALGDLNLRGRRTEDVIDALGAVAMSRDPAARIEAFLWNGGDWAVEVRGNTPPLKIGGPSLQKTPRTIRRGVWLWVRSEASSSPVSATIRDDG